MANISGTAANDTLVGTSADDLIQGLDGNDNLSGGVGNDRLEGGAGDDSMNGGQGNDVLVGGDGGDALEDSTGGNDELEGGAGADRLNVWRFTGAAATTIRMDGGADDDYFGIYDDSRASTFNVFGGDGNDQFWVRGAAVTIDAGAGDDQIDLDGIVGSVSLALGSGGIDRIRIIAQSFNSIGGSVTVTGFDAGDAGDSLDMAEFLNFHLANWDYRTNPFATGHFRLVQSGADALLQVDWNGGNNTYVTVITFVGTTAADLTAYNFGGWASDGSAAAGVDLVGNPFANDVLTGGAGNDYIQGLGGGDIIRGGAGDDRLEGGSDADQIYGGLGDDILEGGGGDDSLHADLRGLDVLRGGDGNDSLTFTRVGDDRGWIELDGGAGDDYIYASVGYQPPGDAPPVVTRVRIIGGDGADALYIYRVDEAEVNAGAGNDRIDLDTYTNARITLGLGSDVVRLSELNGFVFDGRMITFTDFEGGANGDRLDWSGYLAGALPSWDRNSNPFGAYLRLVQSGANTLVQISKSGNVNDFHTFITFENVQASSLGQVNMGGFPPDGSPPVGGTLIGTPNADQITGGGGGDTIFGLGQNDTLLGGGGDDFLYGEEGNDSLAGEHGNDRLEGGTGMDYLHDQSGGNDIMFGGAGRDTLAVTRYAGPISTGPLSTLLLDGGADDDYLTFGGFVDTQVILGNLTMIGGEGNDEIIIGIRANAAIDAGSGNDRLFVVTDPGQYTIMLGSGSDELELYSNVASIGTVTVTDFRAGDLGDRLDLSMWFSKNLTGWDGVVNPFTSGHARVVQSGGATLVQVDRDGGGNGYVTLLTLANVSAPSLTAFNLGGTDPVTRGTSGADQMTGTAAADLFDGVAGNDTFWLQAGGDDGALGGEGNDVFLFGATLTPADVADGDVGTDQIAIQGDYAGIKALALGAGITGFESLAILPGNDIRFGDPGTNFYDYDITTQDGNVAAGVQVIVDANRLRVGEDFTFNGSAESDGRFFVWGGGGIDTLTGGSMNDVFYFGENLQFGASDVVNGGSGGTDQLGLRGNYTIAFGAGQLTGIESIGLVSAQDTRFGAFGSTYNYNLTMNDANVASGVLMTVDGAALRNGETLTFNGSAETNSNFRMFGGQGNDVITTGAGNDIIQGGRGADDMTGGAGADTFRYLTALDSTVAAMDEILDFAPGTDKIDLSRIDANTLAGGDQAFSWIGSNAFTGSGAASAGELRAFESNGTWFVEGDTNGNGVADLVIAIISQPLMQGDFLF
jgi:Ca2+-binding RTX toxin-like protein